jgi:type VI secretion system protein ImpJ
MVADLFPPAQYAVTAMLAVAPSGTERYSAETRVLYDETTGRDEKPVQVGRKNISLRFDTEPADDLVTLPIARIKRDGSGQYVFDEDFIPPCVEISASERVMSLMARLIEILEDKSSRFARSGAGKSWAEFSTTEIANFWLLHTVNSALASLRHHYLTRRGHPESLYMEMLKLGGALCTFKIDSHPRSLPLYDHRNLSKCFDQLDDHIRTHLETIVPTQYINIPLVKRADYFYEAEVTDQRCLDRARWIFGVRSKISEPDLIARTAQVVKLCSKIFLPQLVKRALPGMALTHLPVPPSSIPVRADFQYFSVSRTGPCWDHIVQTRQLGLYVPGDLPEPEVQLLVVLETS